MADCEIETNNFSLQNICKLYINTSFNSISLLTSAAMLGVKIVKEELVLFDKSSEVPTVTSDLITLDSISTICRFSGFFSTNAATLLATLITVA